MNWLLAEVHGPHVSLVAEHIFEFGPVVISNSNLLGALGITVLLGLMFYTARRIGQKRYTRLAVAVLWVYEMLLQTAEDVIGSREKARKIAPLAITMFFLIMINNWMGLLPFVGPLTWHGAPLFRGLAADLNFTFALAIITMVTAQIWAVRTHGFGGNLGRYFGNPFTNPMHAFEGFLELIAEFSRLVALSMRLFGNVFGGEVLLVVMGFIAAWLAPLALPPFMLLELFVGAIQAYIFFMLTVVFVSLASAAHHPDSSSDASTGTVNGEIGSKA